MLEVLKVHNKSSFLLDFGTVLTVWYFLFFILFLRYFMQIPILGSPH